MINILLADDHVIIRAGLRIFISDYIAHSVIDEVGDGDSALKKIKGNNYQLIVLDVNMPNTNSFGLVSNIIACKPQSNILMFSMNAEDIYAKKYLLLGAKGFLSKASPESEIKKALDMVVSGNRYISPELNQVFTEELLGKKTDNPFEKLSPREFEIMLHLLKGESLAEICGALHLQTSTVGTHKARLFQKLLCTNVVDLLALAKVYNVIA